MHNFYLKSHATIDINASELQYLADHLTPEECRRLVAAAHFQSFEEPNALDQAGTLSLLLNTGTFSEAKISFLCYPNVKCSFTP